MAQEERMNLHSRVSTKAIRGVPQELWDRVVNGYDEAFKMRFIAGYKKNLAPAPRAYRLMCIEVSHLKRLMAKEKMFAWNKKTSSASFCLKDMCSVPTIVTVTLKDGKWFFSAEPLPSPAKQ